MNQFADRVRKFYNSIWYPVFVALLVFTGNATGWDILFALLVILSAVPGLFLMHNLDFLSGPVILFFFVVSGRFYDMETSDYHYEHYLQMPWPVLFFLTAGIFLGVMIWFVIRNHRAANSLKGDWVLYSMILLPVVMLANGIFNPNYTPKNLIYVSATIGTLLVFYLLIALFGKRGKEATDRFLQNMVVLGVLLFAELILTYFTKGVFQDGVFVKERIVLGWGVWTSIGGMLTFVMPACFYFAHSRKHGWIYYLLGVLLFGGILLSQSRGAQIMGALLFLVCVGIVCFSGTNKVQNRILTGAGLLFCVVVAIAFHSKIGILVHDFSVRGLGDNGRFEIWKAGLQHFLQYPVFGSGFYDSYVNEWHTVYYPSLYHNNLIQMLGACGAVGLLAYLFHRGTTVRLVFRRPNLQKTFLGLCVLGLLLCSFIDVLFFKTYPLVIYSLVLLYMRVSEKEEYEL